MKGLTFKLVGPMVEDDILIVGQGLDVWAESCDGAQLLLRERLKLET